MASADTYVEMASHNTQLISAAALYEREFPEPRWAIPDLLPEGVCLLAGRPKQGKSWMALDWGLAVATGGVALGTQIATPGAVIYLALEDNPRRLKKRCNKLLPNGNWPDHLYFQTQWPRLDEGGAERLTSVLSKWPDVTLVVIDTLAKIQPRRRFNGNAYADDYAISNLLAPLTNKHGVTILLIHHTRKLPAEDWLDEISGTTGLTGGVDSALLLRRDRGSADAVLHVTGRDIEEECDYALKWDGETARWTIIGDAEQYRLSAERRTIIGALASAGKPMSAKEVAFATEGEYDNVRWLLWDMAGKGQISKEGKRYKTTNNTNSTNTTNTTNSTNTANNLALERVKSVGSVSDVGGVLGQQVCCWDCENWMNDECAIGLGVSDPRIPRICQEYKSYQ